MEDEVKSTQSSRATCASSESTVSDSGQDPHPPPPITANGGEEPKEEKLKDPDDDDQETERTSKRRKICPSALENCEAIFIKSCLNNNSSSNCFSFSFDPKFCSGVSTPEVTPKFGSFNLVAADDAAAAGISSETEEKSVKEKDDEVRDKSKILEVLGSVDGLNNAD